MKTFKVFKTIILVVLMGFSSYAELTPVAENMKNRVDLREFQGRSFLETMLEPETGIVDMMNRDYVSEYEFASDREVSGALQSFDDKMVRSVAGNKQREESLRDIVRTLKGESFEPSDIADQVGRTDNSVNKFNYGAFLGMAAGAGTLVIIDDDNYFYNFGYKTSAAFSGAKSGRSYCHGPEHRANDASYPFYLEALQKYMERNDNPRDFFKTMMELLTESDGSRYAQLNSYGQTLVTDYICVYTAELRRNIMVKLNPFKKPWMNDMTEATFLTAFTVPSGKVMPKGELIDGIAMDWRGVGPTGSSGFSYTRGSRRQLQRLVTDYVRETNPDLVEAVEGIIGRRRDGDLFRGLMEFLNNKRNLRDVRENADELNEAFTRFLMQVFEDANDIADWIEDRNH